MPRTYPKGFGDGLTTIMKHWRPEPHLRQKREVDLSLSDKELFEAMPLGDLWHDAKLVDVYRYMRHHKAYAVPPSWQTILENLDREIDQVCPVQTAPEPTC